MHVYISLPVYGLQIVRAEGGGAAIVKGELEEPEFDPILSLVLAHANAGVDVKDPAYLEGLETAVENIANTL